MRAVPFLSAPSVPSEMSSACPPSEMRPLNLKLPETEQRTVEPSSPSMSLCRYRFGSSVCGGINVGSTFGTSYVSEAPDGQDLPSSGGDTDWTVATKAPCAGGGTGSLHPNAPRATTAVTHQRDDTFIGVSP